MFPELISLSDVRVSSTVVLIAVLAPGVTETRISSNENQTDHDSLQTRLIRKEELQCLSNETLSMDAQQCKHTME